MVHFSVVSASWLGLVINNILGGNPRVVYLIAAGLSVVVIIMTLFFDVDPLQFDENGNFLPQNNPLWKRIFQKDKKQKVNEQSQNLMA